MSHWVFFKCIRPLRAFTLFGLLGLTRTHRLVTLSSFNQALTEGWSDYVESMWGSEGSATDRLRGYTMNDLDIVAPRGQEDVSTTYEYIFGGPASGAMPTWDQPGRGLRNEGYFANCLYQLHRALTDPEVAFADTPAYWHRFNVHISDQQSQRYVDTIWKALRMFSADPPPNDFDEASRVYLTNVLRQFHAAQPRFAEVVQSLFELNNLLMPIITIAEGTSAAGAGPPLDDALSMLEDETRSFVVRIKDVSGVPLAGYVVQLEGANPADLSFTPAGSGPPARHGVRGIGVQRATDPDGVVVVSYHAPALPSDTASTSLTLRATYQPDFDTDASFAGPSASDDLEDLLIKHYVRSLRGASKIWRGVGTNWGARVTTSIVLNVARRP